MRISSNYNTIHCLLVTFICVASTRVWSFVGLPGNVFGLLETGMFLLLLSIVVYHYEGFPIKEAQFTTQVSLLIFLPMISMVAAYLFHGQSVLHSFLALKNNFLWLLYFVLHLLKVPVKKLVIVMFIMGGVWILLTVAQQFTYPTYFFSTRNEETSYDFYRAGVYRFMIDDHHYALFILFFCFYRFLNTNKLVLLAPILLSLLGFYYYGTRQFALSAIVCLVIASLSQKGRKRLYAIVFIVITAIVLVTLKEILFKGYIELTNEQLSTQEEDIRMLSGSFYLFEYWPHWVSYLIGNGLEHIDSDYGIEINGFNKVLGFYKSDVGIVGAFNTFGIFYIINVVWLNIKGLQRKFYTKESQHLRLIFFNALFLLILSEYYSYESAIPFFCIIFYMIDQAFMEKKKLKRLSLKYKTEKSLVI